MALIQQVGIPPLSFFPPKSPLDIVFLSTSFYVLAGFGIGATRPNSVIRWVFLCPVTYLAYAVGRYSFDLIPRLLLTNIVAGTVCAAWTQFIVSGFLLKENFEDAAPQPGGSATYPDKQTTEKKFKSSKYSNTRRRSDTWWQRLLFGINTINSQRNVLTPQRSPHMPPFSRSEPEYVPRKRQFLFTRGAVALISFIFVDLFTSSSTHSSENQTIFSQDKAALFWPSSADDWYQRAKVAFGQWVGLYTVTTWLHSTIAVATVAANVYPPEGWPPLYGSLLDVWSLRRFWGRFWHSMLRYKLLASADWIVYSILRLPRGRLITRYTHLFAVFTASGLCHIMMDIIGPIRLEESHAFQFFVLQPVGITVEDAFQWLWHRFRGTKRRPDNNLPSWWARMLGGVWVCFWLVWLTPMWVYPGFRAAARVQGRKGDFLPFSLIKKLKSHFHFQ